jgi:hypothetical protein
MPTTLPKKSIPELLLSRRETLHFGRTGATVRRAHRKAGSETPRRHRDQTPRNGAGACRPAARKAHLSQAPLAGVPTLIKDNIETAVPVATTVGRRATRSLRICRPLRGEHSHIDAGRRDAILADFDCLADLPEPFKFRARAHRQLVDRHLRRPQWVAYARVASCTAQWVI